MKRTTYHPGETIQGVASVLMIQPTRAKRIMISFTALERYGGEEDKRVFHQYASTLAPAGDYTRAHLPFELAVPEDIHEREELRKNPGLSYRALDLLAGVRIPAEHALGLLFHYVPQPVDYRIRVRLILPNGCSVTGTRFVSVE